MYVPATFAGSNVLITSLMRVLSFSRRAHHGGMKSGRRGTDFALTNDIAAALEKAGPKYTDLLKGWAGEMLADVSPWGLLSPAQRSTSTRPA